MLFRSLSLTKAYPGWVSVNRKWCIAFIPFSARCQKGRSKKVAQSYVGTRIRPSCVPTSCAQFTAADFSTTRTISSRHLILDFRYSCSKSPKHQSGENFVCPTIKEDTVMDLFRPDKTRHARYCMTYLFLFWPEQLSACK